MGQYHIIANTTKQQYLNPHATGTGLKLREIGESGYSTAFTLALLLANDWKNDNIIILGDYGQHTDLPEHLKPLFPENTTPYRHVADTYKEADERARELAYQTGRITETTDPYNSRVVWGWASEANPTPLGTDTTDYRIINHTKKQQITPTLAGNLTNGINDLCEGTTTTTQTHETYNPGATALLIGLLANNNGLGGGDYPTENPLIGTWAGDNISLTQTTDPTYTQHQWLDITEELESVTEETTYTYNLK